VGYRYVSWLSIFEIDTRIQDVASTFRAEEIPHFLHLLFFERTRKRGALARGQYNWIRKTITPTLIVLSATALQWALEEYVRTEGKTPNRHMKPSPQLPFSQENDTCEFKLFRLLRVLY
jgi:hypothetical protein